MALHQADEDNVFTSNPAYTLSLTTTVQPTESSRNATFNNRSFPHDITVSGRSGRLLRGEKTLSAMLTASLSLPSLNAVFFCCTWNADRRTC